MAITPDYFAAMPLPDPLTRPTLRGDGFNPCAVGYALSGGGYKAALFHLGGLIRLNELGWLSRVDRFSSVSGGSITAALLAMKWQALDWQNGIACAFDREITRPLAEFCRDVTIDEPSILASVLPLVNGGERLVKAYDSNLYKGATLRNLPHGAAMPRFVFNATNYELDSLWRISSDYAADYKVGRIEKPNFSLARVVAASSGFPPFFCPIEFDLRHLTLDTAGATHTGRPFNQRALMADGGIYDNMGLEAVWKQHGVLLVSNAGDPVEEDQDPKTWPGKLLRVVSLIHRQAENNRVRWLMEDVRSHPAERRLAYWPGRCTVLHLTGGVPLPALSDEDAHRAATEEVRLRALPRERINRLVRHGYSLANAVAWRYLGDKGGPLAVLPTVL